MTLFGLLHLAQPWWLLALCLPVALWLWRRSPRSRGAGTDQHPASQFLEIGSDHLRPCMATGEKSECLWVATALAFAILALARPQFGETTVVSIEQSRDILVALDLSRSMLTADISPDRLARARLMADHLVQNLEGERVGLIVFSKTAFLQCPLSSDYSILRDILPTLDPDFLPTGGTDFEAMLTCALEAFSSDSTSDKYLVVLSDGEDLGGEWRAKMPELLQHKIRVITLGIGTSAGATVPAKDGGWTKDERGAAVISRLDPTTLEELARSTSGLYQDTASWVDIRGIIESTIAQGRRSGSEKHAHIKRTERYQWFLAAALFCAIGSLLWEIPTKPRPRLIQPAQNASPTAAIPLAFLMLALSFPISLQAQEAPSKPEPSPLAQTLARVSKLHSPTASDWAELAEKTCAHYEAPSADRTHLAPVVGDALLAVDTGEKLGPTQAPWASLRERLLKLLKEEKEQQQQPQEKQPPPQDQQQNQQEKDQSPSPSNPQNTPSSGQDKSGSPQDPSSSPPDQGENQPPKQNSDKSEQPDPNKQQQDKEKKQDKQSPQNSGESSDKNKKENNPPPTMQKAGGKQDKSSDQLVPLEQKGKFNEVKSKDSPSRLFMMLDQQQNKDQQPAEKGKNW